MIGWLVAASCPLPLLQGSPIQVTPQPAAHRGRSRSTADCLAAGHCTIVPDDGHGHHVIGFPLVQVYVVIDAATNVVTQIVVEDPAGQ
jgi:hypothetical protein